MAKLNRKPKWQGYAKQFGVTFQDNDTIKMLVIAVAHKVGVNPDKIKDEKKLEETVEKAVLDKSKKPSSTTSKKTTEKKDEGKKAQTSKPESKKTEEKKSTGKKTQTSKPDSKKVEGKKPQTSKDTNKKADPKKTTAKKSTGKKASAKKADKNPLPDFKSLPEMKHFCIEHKLHEVDGYIVASKGEIKDFLKWITDNKDKMVIPETPKTAAPTPTPEEKKEETPKQEQPKEEKKATGKKSVQVATPDNLSDKPTIEFPAFKNPKEMKDFCVKVGLNLVDGYVLESKKKKTEFLEWMIEHKHLANPQSIKDNTSNPHSPSAGIGELETATPVSEASAAIGQPNPQTDGINPKDIGKVEKTEAENVNVNLPKLSTGEVKNAPKTAIDSNKQGEGEAFKLNNEQPIVQAPHGQGNPQMEDDGNSVIHHLEASFQARFHGGMLVAEFQDFCNVSLGGYQHEIKSDEGGYYLIIGDDNGNQSRFPKQGYLKVR